MKNKRKHGKSILMKMMAFLCAVCLCFSDIAVVSSIFSESRVLAAETDSRDVSVISELGQSPETIMSSEVEIPAESEQSSESESPAESEQPSGETESSEETESAGETESSEETESVGETESSGETESIGETETTEETGSTGETEPVVEAPSQPVLKSAVSKSYNSITVEWDAVSGAEGYRVYRRVSGSTWTNIAQIDEQTVSWNDTGLTCGTTYIYTVRAYVKDNGKYLLSTYDKNGITVTPVPATPKLVSTESANTSVTINWNKTAGATSYNVYRKIPGKGWGKIGSVNNSTVSYTDETAETGVKYLYTVRAKHSTVLGTYDKDGIEGAVKLPAVILKSVCISSKGTSKLQWAKRSGADGYMIYRKEEGGSWTRVGLVSDSKLVFTEKGLESGKNYYYTVVDYMLLNGEKVRGRYDTKGIAPKLEYSGTFVRNVTKTYLGTSGEGRKMYSYIIGTGKNHIVLTMAVHGWEDEWARDGFTLVDTGEQLIEYASGKLSVLNSNDYAIIIVPEANPDGLYSGTTCDGPGRCTTYRYDSNGNLVKGGVDLNRCFPAGFSAKYETRNYTGAKPLMAKEAVILKKFIDSNKGSGKNIFIDVHGWYNQTITRYKSTGDVFKALEKYFPGTRPATFGGGLGYISGYAYSAGYEAALFEFPAVSSSAQFTKKGYADKFINSVFYMVGNVR